MISLPASNETMLSVPVSPGVEEPVTLEGMSVAGPNTGQEGTDVAGPSSGGERTSVASTGAGSVEMNIGGLRSHVSEKMGSVLEDIPGTGGEETTADTTVDSTQRTSQEILGDFAEDCLETQDKDEINSIFLFLCYPFMHAFSFILKLKLQSMLHNYGEEE